MKLPFFNKKKPKTPTAPRRRVGFAALDSTATTPRTVDYYADAFGEAATLRFDRSTREIAQNRGEFELLNDAVLFGTCQKIAALVVGVGPALKIDGPILRYGVVPPADRAAKTQYLEKCFARFATAIALTEKLRRAASELIYHGEIFLRKVPSRLLAERFDYVFIRPERVTDPPGVATDPLVNDGVRYDRPDDAATPVAYYVRKEFINPFLETLEFEAVPAGEIVHIFNPILPGQRRGVPECQSALALIREIKLLRRLEIQAVKNSAKMSVVLYSDSPEIVSAAANDETTSIDANGDVVEIAGIKPGPGGDLPDGIFVASPGYTPTFGDAKHPSTGFDAFKKAIAADVGAALGVGSGKINNDHSSYNFSSAKMDEQIDAVIVKTRQRKLATDFLDVLFNDWLTEFALRDAVAAETLDAAGAPENVARRWLFPEPRAIDREKEAKADEIELRIGSTTLEQIAARRGLDYEELRDRRLVELVDQAKALEASGLGLSTTGAISTAAPPSTEEPPADESVIDLEK